MPEVNTQLQSAGKRNQSGKRELSCYSQYHRDKEDRLRPFGLLLVVFAAAACVQDPEPTLSKIGFGWGGTIWGSGYWEVFEDDTVVYSGFDSGARPKVDGWRWTDNEERSGEVRFHSPGSYARAVAIANKADEDKLLKRVPKLKAVCSDAGQDIFWLRPDEPKPSLIVDGCLSANTAATEADRAYFERVNSLTADLRAAMNTASLIPEG